MLYEYISLFLGIIKIMIFKIIYFKRLKMDSIPKMNNNFKIAIKKNSILKIGKNFRSRYNISFRIYNCGKVTIGNNCFFNDGCSINCQDKVTIGDKVLFGQNVMIFDHDHDYKSDMDKFVKKEVTIGNNVWIGANCIILKGVTIGDNVVIAAGTIVKENIKSNSLIYENRTLKIKDIKR